MSLSSMLRSCAGFQSGAVLIVSGFGSGYSRIAPGTCGSLAALIVWYLVFGFLPEGLLGSMLLVVFTAALGFVLIRAVIDFSPIDFSPIDSSQVNSDPSWVVIDEWAGLFLALLALTPREWPYVLSGFILFRIFDAVKWGPVGWAERLPGAWGIMADDLVAGLFASVGVTILRACCGS